MLTREANLLGALALVITDQTAEAMSSASGQSVSAAATLSALHQILDQPTLDRLSQVLGLTHSGTVRLVDRLESAGLVTRRAAADGRSRSVTLTRKGQRRATQIEAARTQVLARALQGFSAREREELHTALTKMMAAIVADKDDGPWICRLCDLHACGWQSGDCPAATAAAAKRRSDDAPLRPRA